jgi:hypothetical protein
MNVRYRVMLSEEVRPPSLSVFNNLAIEIGPRSTRETSLRMQP